MTLTKKEVMPVLCCGLDVETHDENIESLLYQIQDLNLQYLGLRLIDFDDEDWGKCRLLSNLVRKVREILPKVHLHVFDIGAHGTFGLTILSKCADSISFSPCESIRRTYPPPSDFIPTEGYYNRMFDPRHLVKYRYPEISSSGWNCMCPSCREHKLKSFFYRRKRDSDGFLVTYDLENKKIGNSDIKWKSTNVKAHHLYSISHLFLDINDENKEEFKKKLDIKLKAAIDQGAPNFVRGWLDLVQGN